jgi:hypothetical protein
MNSRHDSWVKRFTSVDRASSTHRRLRRGETAWGFSASASPTRNQQVIRWFTSSVVSISLGQWTERWGSIKILTPIPMMESCKETTKKSLCPRQNDAWKAG